MTSAANHPGTIVEFVAVLADTGLYGITIMQTFLYFVYHSHQDAWIKRLLVIYLLFMNTVHEVLVNRGFWVLISRVDDPFVLSKEYLWGGFFTALVALPTQLFFSYRVWQFSGKKWIFPAIFVPCSLFQFAGSIAFTVLCLNGGPTAHIIFVIEKLPMAFWGVGAAEDMLISLVLMWFIWKRRASTGFQSTNRILHRLSVFVINTGLWTALCALFVIITMAAYPQVQIYVSLYFILCPLYCNALIANLNARAYIRGEDIYHSEYRDGMQFASNHNNPRGRQEEIALHVTREQSDPSETTFATGANSKISKSMEVSNV